MCTTRVDDMHVQEQRVRTALIANNWDVKKAAASAGYDWSHMYMLMRRFSISRPRGEFEPRPGDPAPLVGEELAQWEMRRDKLIAAIRRPKPEKRWPAIIPQARLGSVMNQGATA